jgi:PmbA protein
MRDEILRALQRSRADYTDIREVVGRVKNTMIAGNVYELLKDNVLALSDQAEWVFGILHAPAIAIDAVSVATKS